MNIHDIARNGIDGFDVTNFTFANGQISTTGTASIAGDFEVSAIAFVDRSGANDNTIDGTVSITANLITDPERNAIMIETWAGTISNLTHLEQHLVGRHDDRPHSGCDPCLLAGLRVGRHHDRHDPEQHHFRLPFPRHELRS